MGVIFEMILAESGCSSATEQKQASAQMHETIAALPSTEFPNLTELREAIVAETVQAGAAKPSPDVAAERTPAFRANWPSPICFAIADRCAA